MQNTDTEVTRVEIADFLGDAFTQGLVDREALIGLARKRGARPEVMAELKRLPAGRYPELRTLWEYLGDLPIGG